MDVFAAQLASLSCYLSLGAAPETVVCSFPTLKKYSQTLS